MFGRFKLTEIANLLSLSDFELATNLDKEIARLLEILASFKSPESNKEFYRLQSLEIEISNLIEEKEKALKDILIKSNINSVVNLTVDEVKYSILISGILQELNLNPDEIFDQLIERSINCETNSDLNACEWLLNSIISSQDEEIARKTRFYIKLLFHEETPLICKDFIRKMIIANYYGTASNRQSNQQQNNSSYQEKNSSQVSKV